MAKIDTRFVDYDFTKDKKYVLGDISPFMGLDNEFKKGLCSAPFFEDTQPLIDEADWPKYAADIEQGGLDNLIVEVKAQKNEGSCVGNMWAQQLQVCQASQFGKDKTVLISACSCYKQIGSSPNSGAMVEDAYTEGRDVGALPLDTSDNKARFKHVMPATGFYTKWPPGWEETAAMFRVTEAFICRSVAGIISALFSGFSVGVGRAGHSICYLRPVYNGKNLLVKYVNSWGEWGDKGGDFDYGFGYDSLGYIRQSASWAYAVRSMTVPSFQTADYKLAA